MDFNIAGTAPIRVHDAIVDGGVPFFSMLSKNVQFVLVLPANIAVLAFYPFGLLSAAFPLNLQRKVTVWALHQINEAHQDYEGASLREKKEWKTAFIELESGGQEPKISVSPHWVVQDTRDLASPFNQPLGREIWVCRTRHSNASFIWFQSPPLPQKGDGNFFTGKKHVF